MSTLTATTLDSDSSDEDIPKVKSSRKRGLASRLAKKVLSEQENVSEQSAVYSTRVSKMFGQQISLLSTIHSNSDDEGDDLEENTLKGCDVNRAEPVLHPLLYNSPVNVVEIIEEEERLRPSPLKKIHVDSLSPPPPPPPVSPGLLRRPRRQPRLKKGVKNAMRDLSYAKQYMSMNEIRQKQAEEDEVICIEDDGDNKVTVRIKVFGSQMYRFTMNKYDPLQSIIKDIASKEKVEEKNLLLVHNDRCIQPTDSPFSLNLKVADIIECNHSTGESFDLESIPADTSHVITLQIQGRASKSKYEFKISAQAPLCTLISKYCARTGINAGSVRLQFDGEDILPHHTAQELEIEDGYCIDAIHSNLRIDLT